MLLFMFSFEMLCESVQAGADIAQVFDDNVLVFHSFLLTVLYGYDNTTEIVLYPGAGARDVNTGIYHP